MGEKGARVRREARTNDTPKEDVEQTCLFRWAGMASGKYPELASMYHIPNGGSRNKAEAARLKMQGVRAGVPDVCLPVARGGYHGLYIELKRQRGGIVSDVQKQWLEALRKAGYCAEICRGWDEAREVIETYMKGKAKCER